MLLYAVTALQDYMHYSVGKYDERLLLNLTKTLYFCAHRFLSYYSMLQLELDLFTKLPLLTTWYSA